MSAKETGVLEPLPLAEKHVVLCVDDDPAILASLRRLLRGEPYDLETAASPPGALERLGRGDVSLVIADQRMPGMVGTDFLEEVRRRAPAAIRVMLTGYPGSSSVSYGLADGIEWLISKPWNDEALKFTIRQLLHDRECGRRPGSDRSTRRLAREETARRGGADTLRREIEGRLGYFPPLFAAAAGAPEVLEHLWGHTVSAYLENPLPPLFKERLSAYLGRFCKVPYGLVSHSCALHALGTAPAEILALLEEPPPPVEFDVAAQLATLAPAALDGWPGSDPSIEKGLLRCSVALFLKGANAERCRTELRRLLGESTYSRLLELLSYIRTCHAWAEGHPEISHEGDPRVVRELPALLRGAPRLKEFFQDHVGYVKRERKWVEDKLLELVRALRRREAELRKAQDALEGRIEERTGELSRVNAELLGEIIERREAEEELREMNVILENAVEGISRLDARGRYISVNKAYADMLGRSAEELLGTEWTDAVHPDDRGRLAAEGDRMKAAGKAEAEARGIRPDGSVFHEHVVLIRALDEQGNFIGHYGFMKDITERRRAEEERDHLNAQLLQGQKLAAIGQLAAGVAHEINNPMGFIHANLFQIAEYVQDLRRVWGEVETLMRVAEKAESAELRGAAAALQAEAEAVDVGFVLGDLAKAVRESQEGSERIRHIVQDLRDFSHQDTAERVLADLNQCLDSTANIVWPMMKHVVVLEKRYAELPAVPCFPMQLKQVFMNLLVNAYQAIEEAIGQSGGIGTISLETAACAGGVLVSVRDTGVGIPAEHRGRIFDPFFTTKKVGAGTGLVLSTSFGIVQRHGGSLAVESEPGIGTCFRLFLPVEDDAGLPA